MSANAPKTSRTALLKHLDRVYELARVLAPTEKQASKLVEATYRRAGQSTPPSTGEVRAWLLRLLLQTYATRRSDAAMTSSVSTMRRPADLLQDFRLQTAEDALQRAVPIAFALQSPREQLVLTLCDIVELNLDETAVVLDTEPATLAEEAASARQALWTAVHEELTNGEHTLVEEELPDDALQDALRRVVAPHLGPLPPRLRPSVAALMEQAPRDAAEDFDPPDLFSPSPRTQTPHTPENTRWAGSHVGAYLRRIGIALVIILVTGLTAFLLSSYLMDAPAPPATDLIQLSVQQAETVRPGLQTQSAAEAEQFVLNQLDRRIAVPHIDLARLSGVSVVEINPGVRVPVLVFEDTASNQRITTYAYTYAVLDQLDNRIQLAKEVRRQLQEEEQISLQTRGENSVLVWRNRDDIYVAVTKADPRQVRPRITHRS